MTYRSIAGGLSLAVLLYACGSDGGTAPASAPPAFDGSHSVRPASGGPGTVVLAGGGSEGNQGLTNTWSYRLYKYFVLNGDVDGDGVVRVAIVASSPQSTFMVNYFQWIGTTLGVTVVATDYLVPDRATANNPAVVGPVAGADAVFIKGGDQGLYYDQWNGTQLESSIRSVAGRGGALGGTSAGAMSMAEFCFSGSKDMISTDVLKDARTVWLDDASQPGTSAIHTDFLSFLPGTFVESHFTTRGRLGRLLGILARATEDNANNAILAIGLDERTGVVVINGVAEVIGTGEVAFVHQSPATTRIRDAGHPLVYTEVVVDRLTDGWKYDLTAQAPLTTALPPGVLPVTWPGPGSANSGALTMNAGLDADRKRFQWVAGFSPSNYSLTQTTASPFVRAGVALFNAGNSKTRGNEQETLFRALYDRPNAVGVLGFAGGSLSRTAATPDIMAVGGTISAILVDAQLTRYKGLSPSPSNVAIRNGNLKAAALTDLRVSVLGESAARNLFYNTRLHTLTP